GQRRRNSASSKPPVRLRTRTAKNPAAGCGGGTCASGGRAGGAAAAAAGGTGGSTVGARGLAPGPAQTLNDLQLRDGAGGLGLRFGERHVPAAVPARILGALLGGERRRLIDVLGAQCSVGEHGNLGRLYLERSATDEEVMLLTVGRLHAHLARLEQRQER